MQNMTADVSRRAVIETVVKCRRKMMSMRKVRFGKQATEKHAKTGGEERKELVRLEKTRGWLDYLFNSHVIRSGSRGGAGMPVSLGVWLGSGVFGTPGR